MVEKAVHLTNHVCSRLQLHQRVLSVPTRLRYFMQRVGAVLGMVLRINEQSLSANGLCTDYGASWNRALVAVSSRCVLDLRKFSVTGSNRLKKSTTLHSTNKLMCCNYQS